jgi:hypothetical protein
MVVVVAGAAHYAHRGFTIDPMTREDYWDTLEQALASPADPSRRTESSELALRYAHLFFFRFHQHLTVLDEPGHSRVHIRPRSSAGLAPGHDAGFDRVLNAVLDLDGALVSSGTEDAGKDESP